MYNLHYLQNLEHKVCRSIDVEYSHLTESFREARKAEVKNQLEVRAIKLKLNQGEGKQL